MNPLLGLIFSSESSARQAEDSHEKSSLIFFKENASRGFTSKIKPYFLRKIKVKIKMSSAAIFVWR